ncbi:hypothetical protein H9P43_008294 [Blastocladiella emersonii ATCC 22665]|nr:hypothetical protein H9P43_008294 [Blastocladiella emersonii ATCC 22665]
MNMSATSSAPAKLVPFLLLAKSSRGAASADLVAKVLEAPGVYVFAELMELAPIQQLATTHPKVAATLRVFAYGTLADYKAQQADLLPLTPAMHHKMRLLTLISLAHATRVLPYDTVLAALDLDSPTAVRDLEDLAIEAIYENLLGAVLDQKARALHIEWAVGRDVDAAQLEGMAAVLANWTQTTDAVLATIDRQIDHAKTLARAKRDADAKHDAAVERKRAQQQADLERARRESAGASGPRGGGNKGGASAAMIEQMMGFGPR